MKKSTHRMREMRRRYDRLKETKAQRPAAKLMDRPILVDRIGDLPDDILIIILSRLTSPEAIATSILSTRWRYLHTYVDNLNFPSFKQDINVYNGDDYVNELEYVTLINKTLDSYRGNRVLKQFRVEMDFARKVDIERWFEFALDRQVETIDIRMMRYQGQDTPHLWDSQGRPLPGLNCLKQLNLHGFLVTDTELQNLLSGCPLLERLNFENSRRLINISVAGHGKLKHLGIARNRYLESVEIRDMVNLVSFKCHGHKTSSYTLLLSNLPKLTEFDTHEQLYGNALVMVLPTIPSYIRDQLRVIKARTNPYYNQYQTHLPVLELKNVKHLEIKVDMDGRYSTTKLFPLIEACSSLEKLEIEFLWELSEAGRVKGCEVFEFSPGPHKKLSPNLKKMTISGYLGSKQELEFAMVMMKQGAASLEQVNIEPCDQSHEIQQTATTRALEQFIKPTMIPKSVSFYQFCLLLGFVIVCGLLIYYAPVFMSFFSLSRRPSTRYRREIYNSGCPPGWPEDWICTPTMLIYRNDLIIPLK